MGMVTQKRVAYGILRILLFLAFVVGVGSFASFDSIKYMLMQPDRVTRNFKDNEGENGDVFVSKRITIGRFLYSCSGFVASIPFVLSSMFSKSSGGAAMMKSTADSKSIRSEIKSRSNADLAK